MSADSVGATPRVDSRLVRVAGPTGPAPPPAPTRPRGIGPCVAYLVIEFARPMAWVPVLGLIKPGMLVAFWGLGSVVFGRNRPPVPKPVKYMLGFLALMIWHVPWAMNNRWALWGLEDFAILLFGGVIPLAMIASDLASVRKLLTAYVALHVPMAAYGLLHQGFGQGGWLLDNNDLALALNAGLGVAVFLFLESASMVRRLWLSGAMALVVACVVATTSRGGFVGLASLAMFVLVVSPWKRKLLVSACLAAGVVGVVVLAPPAFWNRIKTIETAKNEGDTGFQRLYLWGMACRMFVDHPVFGVGTNNYGIQAPFYEDTKYADESGTHMWGRVPHSIYLTLISEQGLVGTVLFALIVYWTFSTASKIRRRIRSDPHDRRAAAAEFYATGLLAGVVGVLVSGAFLTVLYYPVFWVLVALMAALDRVTAPRAATTGENTSSSRSFRRPRGRQSDGTSVVVAPGSR